MFNNKTGLLVSIYWIGRQHLVLVANILQLVWSKPVGSINETATVSTIPDGTAPRRARQDCLKKAGNYEYESKKYFFEVRGIFARFLL